MQKTVAGLARPPRLSFPTVSQKSKKAQPRKCQPVSFNLLQYSLLKYSPIFYEVCAKLFLLNLVFNYKIRIFLHFLGKKKHTHTHTKIICHFFFILLNIISICFYFSQKIFLLSL